MARVTVSGIKLAGVVSIVALLAASASAQPSSSHQASIVVAPFGVGGEAPATLAESIRRDLAAALDLDPCIAARADREDGERPANYILRGEAYAEIAGADTGRAFVALQLVDVETSERVWFQNYDYRGIGADLMARDILTYLKSIAPDSVCGRIRSSRSGP
jgi:TolB-like protein